MGNVPAIKKQMLIIACCIELRFNYLIFIAIYLNSPNCILLGLGYLTHAWVEGHHQGFEILTLFRTIILKPLLRVGQHPLFEDPV